MDFLSKLGQWFQENWQKLHEYWPSFSEFGGWVWAAIAFLLITAIGAIVGDYSVKVWGGIPDWWKGSRRFREKKSSVVPRQLTASKYYKTAEELFDFYTNEEAISVQVGNVPWKFPASLAIPPQGDGALADQNISFLAEETLEELDPALESATNFLKTEILEKQHEIGMFDGQPWCLSNLEETPDGQIIIHARRCSYFDAVRTNFSMDVPLPAYHKTLRQTLHGETRAFDNFGESRLPNHMGIVAIIETGDGEILVQKRSAEVAIRPDTLSSSASGTIEEADLEELSRENNGGLISLTQATARRKGIGRETFLELGIDLPDPSEIGALAFLGLVREYRRGGFPDFYFFARTPTKFEEIKARWETAKERGELIGLERYPFNSLSYLADPENELERFSQATNNLLEGVQDKANITLSLGVALTYEHIKRLAA